MIFSGFLIFYFIVHVGQFVSSTQLQNMLAGISLSSSSNLGLVASNVGSVAAEVPAVPVGVDDPADVATGENVSVENVPAEGDPSQVQSK